VNSEYVDVQVQVQVQVDVQVQVQVQVQTVLLYCGVVSGGSGFGACRSCPGGLILDTDYD
jgi:hypothetical protein